MYSIRASYDDYMLFVFINKAAWKTMPEEQRAALVDHELCHFTREEWEEPDPKDQSKWDCVRRCH
ncbi:putative metallopeptidase [Bacillus subtilis]|uniref:putative metallopeptidase n=1 Tax=Bacillus subtilis TaxID=1423 RepID=UPI0026B8BBB7